VSKFFTDLLADGTGKWSLGRVSFAILFIILLVSIIISVVKTGNIPDIPDGFIYLMALLLGYNTATKFFVKVNGREIKSEGGSQ